jgi:hypothetical protein
MSMQRTMVREIGTAFAVLAIYLLTILAPLHQARASQLAFQELGYATVQTGWVLCTPLESPGEKNEVLVGKCPAAGIGKHEAIAPAPAAMVLPIDRAALSTKQDAPEPLAPSAGAWTPLGARAPPVLG